VIYIIYIHIPHYLQQWKRRAKRLATHGAPKNLDSMKYLGSKAIVSLQRNNIPITPVAKSEPVSRLANVPTPVYKVRACPMHVNTSFL